MRSFRTVIAVALLWALVAWLAAAGLALRISDRGVVDALLWYYAVRAPLIAPPAALGLAPLLGRPLDGRWVDLRFPRRARLARAMLRGVAGLLWGLVTGLVGTFLLLFVWPNDAQNGRLDAVKWVGFYWYNHGIFLIPMAWMVGSISGWLWQREAVQKLAKPAEGTW